jgi:hypothetical protein
VSLTKEEKLAKIKARRGTLEHEQYAAELDLKVAEAGDNPTEESLAPHRARVEAVERQFEVLAAEEKALA